MPPGTNVIRGIAMRSGLAGASMANHPDRSRHRTRDVRRRAVDRRSERHVSSADRSPGATWSARLCLDVRPLQFVHADPPPRLLGFFGARGQRCGPSSRPSLVAGTPPAAFASPAVARHCHPLPDVSRPAGRPAPLDSGVRARLRHTRDTVRIYLRSPSSDRFSDAVWVFEAGGDRPVLIVDFHPLVRASSRTCTTIKTATEPLPSNCRRSPTRPRKRASDRQRHDT